MMKWVVRSCIVLMVTIIGIALVKIGGPIMEVRYIPPVRELTFDRFVCQGPDVIAAGVLNKTIWPDGSEAEFLGLTLFTTTDPRERLSWRRLNPADLSPASRPGGLQTITLYVEEGCGVPFTANTRHASPWTGFVMRMQFGPFQE